jgi:hypothetical protein
MNKIYTGCPKKKKWNSANTIFVIANLFPLVVEKFIHAAFVIMKMNLMKSTALK